MKRNLTIAFVGLAMIALTSCKKDYTCECTSTDSSGNSSTSSTTIENAKKSDAEEACNKSISSGGSTIECKLK